MKSGGVVPALLLSPVVSSCVVPALLPSGDSRQPALLPELAVQLFGEVALAGQYAGFLALPADERMPQAALAFDVAFSVGVGFSADNAENATSTENTTGS